MRFEWDANKAGINIEKHGVTFDEATTVFSDEISATVSDPDHSIEEERAIIFGLSASNRHLVVSL
jgi:uncharacterized DUF497 family protein